LLTLNLWNISIFSTAKSIGTKIVKGSEIAYIKINSFGTEHIKTDQKELFEFCDRIGDFKNLIINITGNSGGDTNYLRQNLFRLLEGKFDVEQFMLFKVDNENKEFIEEALPLWFCQIQNWFLDICLNMG
jgi:hypothetical protein